MFGKVGEGGLPTLWGANPVLQTLRKGMPNLLEGVCASCLMRRVCLGSCVAQSYYRTGSLWAPFWFCQQADETGLFPDSRKTSRICTVSSLLGS